GSADFAPADLHVHHFRRRIKGRDIGHGVRHSGYETAGRIGDRSIPDQVELQAASGANQCWRRRRASSTPTSAAGVAAAMRSPTTVRGAVNQGPFGIIIGNRLTKK